MFLILVIYLFFGLKESFSFFILDLIGKLIEFEFFMLLKFLVKVFLMVVVIFVFEMMVVMFILVLVIVVIGILIG